MKPNFIRHRGFTLLETVIAIGVLAVLLTGFLVVFTPAADGIRKSVSSQQLDRLATTLEREMTTLRDGDESGLSTGSSSSVTGFDKAFAWIKDSGTRADDAIFVYNYRGSTSRLRPDGTPEPEVLLSEKASGKDFTVVSMARRKSDSKFLDDLAATDGPIYLVKCRQLVFDTTNEQLKPGDFGVITDSKDPSTGLNSADDLKDAVIAFSADFYIMQSKDRNFYSGSAFDSKFADFKNPVFSRNLAIRR
jgi:prepilin-type N-terminal cleavage/methylation domain-containing protein